MGRGYEYGGYVVEERREKGEGERLRREWGDGVGKVGIVLLI